LQGVLDNATASQKFVESGLQLAPSFQYGGTPRLSFVRRSEVGVLFLATETGKRKKVWALASFARDRFVSLAIFFGFGRWRLGTLAPDVLHETDTLFAQDALNTANGIALAIEQMTDAAQKIDIVGPVVTAAPAPFHRSNLREAAFPEPQNVLRHIYFVGNFTDRAERIRRFFQGIILGLRSLRRPPLPN